MIGDRGIGFCVCESGEPMPDCGIPGHRAKASIARGRPMTALPLRDFTDAERTKLEAIEAAPAAEESVRERVAVAIFDADHATHGGLPWDDADLADWERDVYRKLADAALIVMAGAA